MKQGTISLSKTDWRRWILRLRIRSTKDRDKRQKLKAGFAMPNHQSPKREKGFTKRGQETNRPIAQNSSLFGQPKTRTIQCIDAITIPRQI